MVLGQIVDEGLEGKRFRGIPGYYLVEVEIWGGRDLPGGG
jgi:hypothetical protein